MPQSLSPSSATSNVAGSTLNVIRRPSQNLIGQTRRSDDTYYQSADYLKRTNPDLVNELLYQSVPVLKYTDWKITNVNTGFCETLLPLNHATTNQHGTHQAALISLSADYTGGMALTTVLKEVPIAGIHRESDNSASLWLASMDVKYLKPSTGHLIGRCDIDSVLGEKLFKRYQRGKRILVTLEVNFESNGEHVAIAQMKYFAQPTSQLLDGTNSISPLLTAKIKASARMIAGVRSSATFTEQTEDGEVSCRVDCPHSSSAAGPHGMLLAERLKEALPQLPPMVLARTRHVDEMLHSMKDLQQVVMLGAGLDMRPFRYADKTSQESLPHFFELDLAEMLVERQRVVQLLDPSDVPRTTIAANFLHDDVASLLLNTDGFDPHAKTAFIYEGCSMYFDAMVNASMLKAVSRMMKHEGSRFWADFVSADVADGSVDHPAIQAFLRRMTEMGESFIFGVDQPELLLQANGLRNMQTQTVSQYIGQHSESEEVLTRYMFTVSSRSDLQK